MHPFLSGDHDSLDYISQNPPSPLVPLSLLPYQPTVFYSLANKWDIYTEGLPPSCLFFCYKVSLKEVQPLIVLALKYCHFLFQYPFKFHTEYWRPILPQIGGLPSACSSLYMKGIIVHAGIIDVMITVPTNWPFNVRKKDSSYYYFVYSPFMKK